MKPSPPTLFGRPTPGARLPPPPRSGTATTAIAADDIELLDGELEELDEVEPLADPSLRPTRAFETPPSEDPWPNDRFTTGANEGTLPPEEDDEPRAPGRLGSLLSWGLFGLIVIAFGIFIVAVYLPAEETRERLRVEVIERDAGLDAAEARDAELREQNEALQRERQQAEHRSKELQGELAAALQERGALAKVVAAREAELASIKKAQDAFAKSLDEDVARGDVSISRRGRQLVVDVKDGVLFPQGDAELNDKGKEVLRSVAKTVKENPDRVFQVGGHSDNVPVSDRLASEFPTNWELSVLRATYVVRFLQEQCDVPGNQLVAAGFSQYRPVTNNKNATGRRRNRRIEIVMLEKD